MQVAHMGSRWVVGNGEKIRFSEDQWFGNTSLAIIFWPLYVINEQQGKTIKEVRDGEELKLSFRRTISNRLMLLWDELSAIGESITLNNEEDQILWSYNSNVKFSVQSLYAIINHRGWFQNLYMLYGSLIYLQGYKCSFGCCLAADF
jgi:hypothetical protein